MRQAAMVVVEEHRARGMLRRLGEPAELDHPVFELLTIASKAKAWHDILTERLSEIASLEVTDAFGAERERAVVVLYERSLDRVAKILTDILKLQLQERALRINEDTAARVMQALVEALRRAGLSDHEQEVRQHLKDVLGEMRTGNEARAGTKT